MKHPARSISVTHWKILYTLSSFNLQVTISVNNIPRFLSSQPQCICVQPPVRVFLLSTFHHCLQLGTHWKTVVLMWTCITTRNYYCCESCLCEIWPPRVCINVFRKWKNIESMEKASIVESDRWKGEVEGKIERDHGRWRLQERGWEIMTDREAESGGDIMTPFSDKFPHIIPYIQQGPAYDILNLPLQTFM